MMPVRWYAVGTVSVKLGSTWRCPSHVLSTFNLREVTSRWGQEYLGNRNNGVKLYSKMGRLPEMSGLLSLDLLSTELTLQATA